MKKLLFLTAAILLAAANFYADGQELTPKKDTNGKWGYTDKTGKEVIPINYTEKESENKKQEYLSND